MTDLYFRTRRPFLTLKRKTYLKTVSDETVKDFGVMYFKEQAKVV